MKSVPKKKSVIVIGAGMGGMATAARLAKKGFVVSLYEAGDRHGGKCRTEWINGYAFDTGPSLLTLPAVYRDLFARTGDVLGRVVDIKAVDPSFDYRFHDGTSVQFKNLSRKDTLHAIEKSLGADAATEWNQIMTRAEAMWDVSREPFIESELTSIRSLIKRRTIIRDLAIIAPWKSMRSLQINNPYLRKIIDRYATYSGSDPRVAPAVLSSIAFVEEAFGAWHITGGVGTLADALYQRCLDRGVTFTFNAKVVEITHEDNRVSGIRLSDGTVISSEIVVSNSDATLVYSNLLKDQSKAVRKASKKITSMEPSLAGFSLLLGLKPSSDEKLHHHTILFPEDYDAEFNSIFTQYLPVEDPTIYICAPQDESMVTTNGHQAWFVLVNAPRHDPTGKKGFDWRDKEFVDAYAQKIIHLIEARGIPIHSRLDLLEIRTPADLENSVMAPGGSIYGTSSNGASSAFNRAKNRTPIAGLYCVGGSAHPGGGLPLVGLSAEIVAEAIINEDAGGRPSSLDRH
jgi:phytoene desaturase